MTLNDQQWDGLLDLIDGKKCTPFIGAGASAQWLPVGAQIARRWAKANNYPLEDSDDLSKVAQYLAIKNTEKDLYPKRVLSQELKKIPTPNFASKEYENSPYAVLADLPFSIYITTNYDYFMEEALESKNRKPVSEFCRWNNYAKAAGIRSVFDSDKNYTPSVAQPLVYHLHGNIDVPQSMVLTEIDYIDFILSLNRDLAFSNKENESKIIPSTIRTALVSTSLLFIGYSLRDMNFRIMFRNIVNHIGERSLWSNVAVIKPHSSNTLSADSQTRVQDYLNQYTSNMFKANVYWGDGTEFSVELRRHWDMFNSSKK
jgi:hypothetical protein